MISTKARFLSPFLKLAWIAAFGLFLLMSFVIIVGVFSEPYGFEGIYQRCAHLEPTGRGKPSGELFGEPFWLASKTETLATVFGTWGVVGFMTLLLWLSHRFLANVPSVMVQNEAKDDLPPS